MANEFGVSVDFIDR